MRRSLSVLLLIVLFNFHSQAQSNLLDIDEPQFINGEILVEANDAGEVVTLTEAEYYQMTGLRFLEHLVSFFNFKMSWETVASYITPEMEEEFDIFMIVNVDFEKRQNMADEVPAQHMKVIQKMAAGQKLFKRKNGLVTGILPNVVGNNSKPAFAEKIKALNGTEISGEGVMEDLIPISSGAGHKKPDPQAYADTPTGIYRINHEKSDIARYGSGMFHSLYFDLIYPWDKVSGLAIHGTNKSKYKLLGKHQDSHGCIRTKQNVANLMYENLINDGKFWTEDLIDLDNTQRLKSQNGETKPGVRALIIIFYGYDKELEVFDI